MEDVTVFRGQYGFLSNFHDCSVEYEGLWYGNAEAAYQAAKTNNFSSKLPFRYYSGVEAKKVGRTLSIRPDWNNLKIHAMYDICKAKFKNNAYLRDKLVETHPRQLIQGNDHGDTFWGQVNGQGSNFLGRILMIIRDEIIEEDSTDVMTTQDLYEIDGY